MKTATIAILAIGLLATIGITQDTSSDEPQSPMRIFLFSAKPTPEAWQFMKENPGDRRAATEGAMEKIGGKMLGYYWGLTTGKNYIIAAVPDGRTAQAMLIQRLSSGLVLEYEAIELVESSEMPAVFERLVELDAADDSVQ
jgi:uncharacterized protein with GYD domain